ncbi:MAG: hypothetical protein QNI93_15900 [Kiloniellales bacterium]|nr:hypothetical protein [Kiloniellales bacterium]
MGALNVLVTNLARRVLSEEQKLRLKRGDLIPFYDTRDWSRIVLYETCNAFIRELGPDRLDALEISSGHNYQQHGFKSYRETKYPDFDIC